MCGQKDQRYCGSQAAVPLMAEPKTKTGVAQLVE